MAAGSQHLLDRIVIVLAIALVLTTGLVAILHDRASGAAAARPAAGPARATATVPIMNFLYAPATITVKAGAKITFTNKDDAPHTATTGASPNPDGVFDTGTLTKGQSKAVTVTKPGTFAYYCAIHPFMKGTVTVK